MDTYEKLTPAQRAERAFRIEMPDKIPTFELEFQLAPELFGRELICYNYSAEKFAKLSRKEQEKYIDDEADFTVKVYEALDYSIIPCYGGGWAIDSWEYKAFIKAIRDRIGSTRLLGRHGDGTFSIPDGNHMYDFAYRLYDDPDGMKRDAENMCRGAIENNKKQREAGIDVVWLCSDYCYNSGPFMSPDMFSEYVTPYLARILSAAKAEGLWTIKHTDGDIMPILDQLVSAEPHAIHSLDPMAGVDIAEIKRLYGDKVALCGNVNCALMQTGTDDEVRESAMYALKHGMPGGGYFFCTSNVPFRGMPPERYRMILDIWRNYRDYPPKL